MTRLPERVDEEKKNKGGGDTAGVRPIPIKTHVLVSSLLPRFPLVSARERGEGSVGAI